ncbi:Gfo/Idh/MocA family oxidoreductase [Paenibacillus kribbensis]|uniref:Gfo/Idh/MocA family protein n=1 Tax=Paenibacillus kribbensis TaxID=172713 RepID=UPI002DBBABE3|nr:Gfo/Idh/MocA family oxidoreductase [Paenibacillus kribbensis]MEC0236160.1 Gfo/Idh/MocA family oxidoreductase [Paenibacillus kribbensis]
MERLQGIIVGSGHFAHIQMEAWAKVKGGAIIAVVSQDTEGARRLAEAHQVSHWGADSDIDKLIHELKPDFLDICTPPDSHFKYAKIAADQGISVLCQKPVAPSQEESEQLVRYCRDKGVPVMINENWRWQGWYREIRRIIDSGQLGRLFQVYFSMRPGDGFGQSPYPLQPYFKDMEKFLLYETGVHWIDTFRYLFGEIESVCCQMRTWNPLIKGEDAAIVLFNFVNGMTGIYDANRVVYATEVRPATYGWMNLEGELGNLRLDKDGRIFITLRGETEQEHAYSIPDGWKGGSVISTHQHFIDGLLSGDSFYFETEGEKYMISQRIVYACYQSVSEQRVVTIS